MKSITMDKEASMKFYIGNWENDYVTTLSAHPTDRQLWNALKRMEAKTFRYAPVGDRSVSDSEINEYNARIERLLSRR